MMQVGESTIKHPIVKAASAWIAAFSTEQLQSFFDLISWINWGECGKFVAFLYSCCLLYEYLSKKFSKSKGANDGTR